MAVFVCMHGAGGHGSYWDLVAAELARRGHEVVAPDLPCDREVGLDAYVDRVIDAIGDRRGDLVLVAQSLAGFVAPLVAVRIDVELMVLVAAMVPRPGESGAEWWTVTGHERAVAAQGLPDDSPETLFVHDVPAEVLASLPPPREQTATLFGEPWPLDAWPDVPTRFLLCRDDRLFPADFQRRVVRERLGITPDEMGGGHLPALARPVELAERLHSIGSM
jgi:pimeloyl-ACP methyl ester carboxylesterase